MNFKTHSHRYGQEFLEYPDNPNKDWHELKEIIKNISDNEIIEKFMSKGNGRGKSVSQAINSIIKDKLIDRNWRSEPNIFNPEDPNHPDPNPKSTRFRLDFAKNDLAVEVAFNHGEAISWNLLKPVLSSEMNYIQKEINTRIGVIITATSEMKIAGGFDNAVGTYEKYIRYLITMNTQLVSPLVIMGLNAPETFIIEHDDGKPKKGHVKNK